MVWRSQTFGAVRQAIETAEQFADHAATLDELQNAHRKSVSAYTRQLGRNFDKIVNDPAYATRMRRMALAVNSAHPPPLDIGLFNIGEDAILDKLSPVLLRCVFGNPFRSVTIDRRWRTSTVTDLANAIYDDRAFERMPILADALMDAGCDNESIIAHCQQKAEHVRGCWIVDLLLRKENPIAAP
jgi:hypothetical protein